MAPHQDSTPGPEQVHKCHSDHICSLVPPYLLKNLVDSATADPLARVAAQRTLTHSQRYREARIKLAATPPAFSGGIQFAVPPSTGSKSDVKGQEIAGARHLYRLIYDSDESNNIPGQPKRREGQPQVRNDDDANAVYDSFEKTFEFYHKIFDRNSIDDNGLNLIASVHYDNIPGPPGYSNAFWSDQIRQMVFGDGDQIYFASFTKDIDIIAHELTHGVTSLTANLPYHRQSGALNESISDVFGSMVKQFSLNQTVDKADWLIGANIFTPKVKKPSALRSMKAPGTAYDDPNFGKDPQPWHMSGFQNLPDDDDNDYGGVHLNSGIPNHAFYLAATKLGGHSWDDAGRVWYATLLDKNLQQAAQHNAADFKLFANLTLKHAGARSAKVLDAVREAWKAVGVLDGTTKSPLADGAPKAHL